MRELDNLGYCITRDLIYAGHLLLLVQRHCNGVEFVALIGKQDMQTELCSCNLLEISRL